MASKFKKQPDPIPMTEYGESLLAVLLANVLDEDVNLIRALTFSVAALNLGDALAFYAHAFSVVEEMYPLPCSRQTLAATLRLRGVADVDAKLDKVMSERTQRAGADPVKVIRVSARLFENWYRRQSKITRLKRALAIAENPGGLTPAEEDRLINEELSQITPLSQRVETMTLQERHELWIDEQDEAASRARQTGSAVPIWPWEMLNLYSPGLDKGDPALFAAQTKFGKTTIADNCAEWWAWQQGYAVCIIALETTWGSYNRRFIARHAGIPPRFFKRANTVVFTERKSITVSPIRPRSDPYWAARVGKEFVNRVEAAKNRADGIIVQKRIKGGGDGLLIANVMQDFVQNVAEPAGKEAVFIIDYLQAMDYELGVEERITLTRNTNIIKNAFDSLGCYGMLLSQEHVGDPSKGVENAKQRKTASFGSTMPLMRTQTYLSLQRPLIDGENAQDEPVVFDDRYLHNGMGEQRFYAVKGSPTGAKAQIVVVAANEGQQGVSVRIAMESDLFSCYCPIKVGKEDPIWGMKFYPMLVDETYKED